MPTVSSPSGPTVRRSVRVLALAVAVVPTVGFIAGSGSADPTPTIRPNAHSSRSLMAYDRDAVVALQRQDNEARRARVLGWYRAAAQLDGSRQQADQQRASRGEPRQALSGTGAPAQYWRPTVGPLTQPFHPGHDGIDIGVPIGTPVLAAADGVVTFAGEESGYGTHVELQHADGTVTTYSHLSRIDVAVGEPVKAGQQIAESGNTGHSTGPHLHFEVHPTKDSLTDPIAWLQSHGAW